MANLEYLHRHQTNGDNNLDPFFSEQDDLFSDTESVILNPHPSFVMDLFNHRSDSSYDVAFDLDFGLSFDNSSFHNHDSSSNHNVCFGGDDDFCVEPGPAVGLRVAGFGSDSESEEGINEDEYCLDRVSFGNNGDVDDDNESVTIPLCWDSLQLEDHREDFEWVVDEREVINMFNDDEEEDDAAEEASVSLSISPEDLVNSTGLEWEVLLNANPELDVDRNAEPYFADPDDYIDTGDYETLFGQFIDNEMGRPPAAKSVVHKLPSVVFTQEDVDAGNSLCAVCKDDISVGEKGKQLPCSHRYHGECIVPWLGIRNTCPVCRHELPTDDVEYERRKAAQRTVVSAHLM